MAHIHEFIDFTIAAYVIRNARVLLVFHKQLQKWLPLGGHIELDEDPEEALHREVKEESGLDIDLIGEKPARVFAGFRFLHAPAYLDIHDINPHHKHIGMTYFARARTDAITLAEREHDAIRWFTSDDLADPAYAVPDNVQFYAEAALALAAEEK